MLGYCICSRVAPLVGAWIEIFYAVLTAPMFSVAPLVGAWIEIDTDSVKGFEWDIVAPLVGAWIEICGRMEVGVMPLTSLLSWERGLKSQRKQPPVQQYASRSSRGSVD